MPAFDLTEITPTNAKPDRLLLTDLYRKADYDVAEFSRVTAQAVLVAGTWGSGVVTFYASMNGRDFSAFATPVRLSADGFTADIDTRGFNYLRAVMTTAGSSSSYIDLFIKGWKD